MGEDSGSNGHRLFPFVDSSFLSGTRQSTGKDLYGTSLFELAAARWPCFIKPDLRARSARRPPASGHQSSSPLTVGVLPLPVARVKLLLLRPFKRRLYEPRLRDALNASGRVPTALSRPTRTFFIAPQRNKIDVLNCAAAVPRATSRRRASLCSAGQTIGKQIIHLQPVLAARYS